MPAWLALLSSLSFIALNSMAALGTLTIVSERLKWGREDARPRVARGRALSNFSTFRQFQRILDVDTQIPDRVLDLGMTEQYLDRTKISGSLVDHRSLRASKRVRAVIFPTQSDRSDPLIDQPSIVAGAEMISVIDWAWKCEVIYGAASSMRANLP